MKHLDFFRANRSSSLFRQMIDVQNEMMLDKEFGTVGEFQMLGLSSSSGDLTSMEIDDEVAASVTETKKDAYFGAMEKMFGEREKTIEGIKGFGKYRYKTRKFCRIRGVWKGITALRVGDRETGAEEFTVTKKIGEKRLIVRKTLLNGKELQVKTYAQGMGNEEEVIQFEQNWVDFTVDKSFDYVTPETPLIRDTDTMFSQEIVGMKLGKFRSGSPDPVARLTGETKKSFSEEKKEAEKCYVSSFKSVTLFGKTRSVMTRKDRDSAGNEKTTVQKGLGDRKVSYIKKKYPNGKVANEKKFVELEEKHEAIFLKEWDGFIKVCEEKLRENVYESGRTKTPKIILV